MMTIGSFPAAMADKPKDKDRIKRLGMKHQPRVNRAKKFFGVPPPNPPPIPPAALSGGEAA
jgi:hypothetical protein